MIEPDINERMARFSPSQNIRPEPDPIALEVIAETEPDVPPMAPSIDPIAFQIARESQEEMMATLRGASAVNPDQAARAQRIGEQIGIGQDVVLRNMPEMEREAVARQVIDRDMLRHTPNLARFLGQREFATIAHDDIDNLTKVEKLFRWVGGIPKDVEEGLSRAVATAELGRMYYKQMQGVEPTWLDKVVIKSYNDELGRLSKESGFIESAANIVGIQAELATEVVEPALMGTVMGGGAGLVGGPFAPATVPAGMALGLKAGAAVGFAKATYILEAGNAYGGIVEQADAELSRRRDEGLIDAKTYGDEMQKVRGNARNIATGVGLVNAGLEMVGLKLVAAPFQQAFKGAVRRATATALTQQTTRAALGRAGLQYGLAVAGETGTEVMQEIVTVAGEELASYGADLPTKMSTEKGRAEVAQRLVDTVVETAQGMTLVGLPGPAANFYVNTARAAEAQKTQRFITDLSDLSQKDKLAERSGPAFERFIAAQAEGTKAETIYVDAQTMQSMLAQAQRADPNLTNEVIDEAMPGVREQIARQVDIGGDVTIPTSQFAARLARTDFGRSLIPHVRLSPDAMSVTEAQQFMGRRADEVKEARALLEAKNATETNFVQEADEIRTAMKDQLVAAGRDDLTADAESTIYQAMIVTAAAREGMTPRQYQQQFGRLEVVGVGAPAAAMEQARRSGVDIEALRAAVPADIPRSDARRDFYGEAINALGDAAYRRVDEYGEDVETGGTLVRDEIAISDKVAELQEKAANAVVDRINAIDDSFERLVTAFGGRLGKTQTASTGSRYTDYIAQDGEVIRVRVSDHGEAYAPDPYVTQISVSPQELNPQQAFDAVRAFMEEHTADDEAVMEQAARMDAEYLAAVERGDMDTAQRMVDEVANQSMPDSQVRQDNQLQVRYHGGKAGITVFEDVLERPSSAYGGAKKNLHNQGIWLAANPGVLGEEGQSMYEAAAYAANYLPDAEIYPVYVNITNPKRIGLFDASGVTVEELQQQGYDGAYIVDTGAWVAFSPNQIKRSNPVTYDESGAVVPLSRRFDITSPRIFEQAARSQVQQRARQLGLPATTSTATMQRQIEVLTKDPRTWTREDFDQVKDYLSIHQDLRPGSAERADSIMREGLRSGMVDSVGSMDAGRWTWAGALQGGEAYVFPTNTLRFLAPDNPHLAAGNRPLFKITTQPGQSIYEAIRDTAQMNPGAIPEPPNIYEQAAGPRGGFDPGRMRLFLTKQQDSSTVIHELTHFALQSMTELAATGRASPQVLADLDLLFQWRKDAIAGDTPEARLATWLAMSIDQQRTALQEPLAYNGEIYFFEGKAPSAELRGVFDRLRSFMLRVYKSIRDEINAIYRREFGEDLPMLTPEVRGVFDRMLASEEQIRRQTAINEMKPAFQTQAESGMDDATWAAYKAMEQEAIEASVTDMTKASLRQMQWLGGARSRVLRDLQKKHDAARKEVAQEVSAAVRVEPVYRAMTYLRYGKFIDADGQEVEVDGPHRLSLEGVKAIYADMPSEESAALLRAGGTVVATTRPQFERLGYGRYGMLAEEGGNPDMVAELFGFSSGDEMIRALLAAKPVKEEVAARTDAEMMRRYGDMNTPAAQEAAVQEALHNEARGRFVAVEYRFLSRATQPVRVMLEAARQVAQELLADKRIRDIRPSEFVAAEARAARDAARIIREADPAAAGKAAYTRAYNEAIASGAPEEVAVAGATAAGLEATRKAQERSDALRAQYGADPQQALIRAKRAQLYQNQLAAESLKVKAEIDKGVKYLRKVLRDTNVKAMGADAADQIGQLLERFEVAAVSLKRLDERKSLAQWMASMEASGLVPDIAPELVAETGRVNYREMTVAQFRDLVDAIRQIEYVGKNERKVQLAAERAAYEEKRDEVVTRIRAVGRLRGLDLDPRSPLTNIGRKVAALRGFAAQHLKAASVAYILDGGKEDGPLWNFVIRTANAAADKETTMRAEASAALAKILAPVFALGNMGGKGVFFPSINRSLNREARIAIAMNMGNAGNMQRLLDGEGWTMEQIQPVLESLTEAEWKAVQQVWDYIDTYRPLIAEKERRLYGKEPNWVEPQPLTVRTADGKTMTLEGGYYPVKYDPVASDRVATVDEAAEAKRALEGAYTAATTRRSFTKARAKEVKDRPILYTLDAAFSGVNDVIHDLNWHEWLIQTNRLLRDPAFANAVRETRGPEFLRQLRDWTKDNAAGEGGVRVAGEAALSWLRQGISASGLGFNVVSAAMQITGFNQSIVKIGAKYVGRGIAQFAASPIDTAQMVADKSAFMRERGRTQFREINEIRNRVRGQTEVARRVTAGTYFLMMNMQRTVDIPTWLGSYQKALDAGKDDATAVALADQAVRDTQGSGLISDLAAVERGGPVMKLFTVFYSYMNTVYNMTAMQTMTARSRGKLAADYAMLLVVPVVLGYAIKAMIQPDVDDDELDPEALARKLAAEELSFLMGTMVIVREFGGAAQLLTGAEGVRMGYGGPAGLRAVGEVYGLATQAGQLEFDRAFRRSAINTLGAFTGLPSAQVNRTIDGIEAVIEDEVEGIGAVAAPFTGVKR